MRLLHLEFNEHVKAVFHQVAEYSARSGILFVCELSDRTNLKKTKKNSASRGIFRLVQNSLNVLFSTEHKFFPNVNSFSLVHAPHASQKNENSNNAELQHPFLTFDCSPIRNLNSGPLVY